MVLETANWWVDATNVSADGLSLIDLSGNNRPAVFGTTTFKPQVLPYNGTPYIHFTACPSWGYENYIIASATGDMSAADLDIRIQAYAADWRNISYTPSSSGGVPLVSRWTGGATGALWNLRVVPTSGILHFQWSATGAAADSKTASSTAAIASNAGKIWIRVTLDVDNGAGGYTVKFYTSTNATTWTQLGTDVTVAGVTSVANSAEYFRIGGWAGGDQSGTWDFYQMEFRIAIDGPVVVFCSAADAVTPYINFTSGSRGWTIGRTSNKDFVRTCVVDRPIVLFSGGQKADVVGYRPSGDNQPLTVMISLREFSAPDSHYYISATTTFSGGLGPGWVISRQGGPSTTTFVKDGTTLNQGSVNTPHPVIGTLASILSKANMTPYYNGAKGVTQVKALTTTTPDADLALGHLATFYGNFELLAAAVFERELSDAEIALGGNELLNKTLPTYLSVSDIERKNLMIKVPGALVSDSLSDLRMKLYNSNTPGFTTVSDYEKKYIEGQISDEVAADSLYDLRRKNYKRILNSTGAGLTTDDMHTSVERLG